MRKLGWLHFQNENMAWLLVPISHLQLKNKNLQIQHFFFSYKDCEKFMFWKSMTQWWLFPGPLPPITIYKARDQSLGTTGSPADRKGTSISPWWPYPSLVAAGLSLESQKGLWSSASIGCFWVILILSVALLVLEVLLDSLKCPGSSQGSPMPDAQCRLFATGWSVF